MMMTTKTSVQVHEILRAMTCSLSESVPLSGDHRSQVILQLLVLRPILLYKLEFE